ncbi:O-antigen ligase family protein [Chamaesiphon sp. VAR_48_metabat_135_sub]|uniref:O-antigen ligase family protein n=1 Tax=Chamaesiphon sp. VAR_48_metabat_135_sub TaxID=2964699 RepID=UPI00286B0D06|nr:O-antigen ligase family protein [Chamaesiphon sp. VAR_48_metabat_135_sub]
MSITLFQFATKKSGLQTFLDRYQYILSIVATFLFFSDLPDYLHTTAMLPLNPLAWIGIFIFLSLPFIKKIATIPKPLIIWMVLYIVISMLSLATISSDEASMKEIRMRVLSLAFLCMMYALYEQKSLKHVKYVILAVVLMSVGNDFFELLNPKVFTELNVGRPGGFYINPNKSGCALVLGLIFTIDIVKKQHRWLYLLVVGAGIACTFSRGSLLGWTLCALFLTIARVLSDKRRTVLISIVSLVLLLALTNPLKNAADFFGGNEGASWDVVDRLEQFQNPSLEDDSAKERKAVVGYAWLMFGNHPFWGNGLASTHKWTVSEVSTHNMYLLYMADHGILGFIILPGAIWAVAWRNRGEPGFRILCFVVFMSLWGIFSHDILEEKYILCTFALLAAMNTNQQWYHKYSHDRFQAAQAPEHGRLILPPARNQPSIESGYSQRLLPPSRK